MALPLLRALDRVAAASPACGSLADVEHVVIFIQENRSFDHYFGRYPGVRGYDDRRFGARVFRQANAGNTPDPVLPFHVDSAAGGECIHDVGHQWVEQHRCWHGGANDAFVSTHVAAEGPTVGPLTMGYYDRADLPFYWALADAFTICDGYFTSALSGTVANRIYGLTGMLDPDGRFGGPVINTPEAGNQQDYQHLVDSLSWRTYPEVLEDAGVSWKVYNPNPADTGVPVLNDNYLLFFKQYYSNPTLAQKAFASQDFPVDFTLDCRQGTLPQVSWVLTPFLESEHPPTPLTWGEFAVGQVLDALTANPDVWSKTVLLLTWDDTGGFFDHVPPPVPSNPQEPGEHLTASPPVGDDGGITGPIGLGGRVPMLVISPFSANPTTPGSPDWRPQVCSDVFDHTSVLRFLGRWLTARGLSPEDVALPYDTAWRRGTVGDLTSAFSFASVAAGAPAVTPPSAGDFAAAIARPECATAVITEAPVPQPSPYPIPAAQAMPTQEPGTPIRPTGLACAAEFASPSPRVSPSPSGSPAPGLPDSAPAPPGELPFAVELALGGALLTGAWLARRSDRAPLD